MSEGRKGGHTKCEAFIFPHVETPSCSVMLLQDEANFTSLEDEMVNAVTRVKLKDDKSHKPPTKEASGTKGVKRIKA